MNKERVLNIAKALRESPNPDNFYMGSYRKCGTPACAFGHYAAREDLQSEFGFDVDAVGDLSTIYLKTSQAVITHGHEAVATHFDLTAFEVSRLFGCYGEAEEIVEDEEIDSSNFLSMSAETANDAADWIERFAAEQG